MKLISVTADECLGDFLALMTEDAAPPDGAHLTEMVQRYKARGSNGFGTGLFRPLVA
jgi:hypothetical protein